MQKVKIIGGGLTEFGRHLHRNLESLGQRLRRTIRNRGP
jgi:hypothetical protein